MAERCRIILIAVVCGMSVLAAPPGGAAAQVEADAEGIVALEGLGGNYSSAVGITDDGTVIGYSKRADTRWRAVRWDTRHRVHDLGTLGGPESGAFAVNQAGTIVGWAHTTTGQRHATRWDTHERITDLGTLPGASDSSATAINPAGTVIGTATTPTGTRAVRWDPTGHIHDLGTLPGDTGSRPVAINPAGVIVGTSTGGGATHAVRWDPQGRITPLRGLGGRNSSPTALNTAGTAVGEAQLPDGHTHATRWDNTGAVHDLGVPIVSGYVGSSAAAIADDGTIVGAIHTPIPTPGFPPLYLPILWSRDGQATELPHITPCNGKWQNSCSAYATGIGVTGTIIGRSNTTSPYDGYHAVTWTRACRTIADLGVMSAYAEPHAINRHDIIVGTSHDIHSVDGIVAVLWPGPIG